ncbi:MAG: hypothetical protein AAB342_05280 [Chloroflexota bacterium]
MSDRLTERGQAYFGCPDKVSAVRLAPLRAAGQLSVPFTTGILIGIGEPTLDRQPSLVVPALVTESAMRWNYTIRPGSNPLPNLCMFALMPTRKQ